MCPRGADVVGPNEVSEVGDSGLEEGWWRGYVRVSGGGVMLMDLSAKCTSWDTADWGISATQNSFAS